MDDYIKRQKQTEYKRMYRLREKECAIEIEKKKQSLEMTYIKL